MKILLTGGTGFVGRAVLNAFNDAGHTVRVANRDTVSVDNAQCEYVTVGSIDGQTDWRIALRGIDGVVHLAARTHHIASQGDDERAYRAINVDGTRALCEAMSEANVQRAVFMSSIKVNGEVSPLDPDGNVRRLGDRDTPLPTTAYGRTKFAAEQLLEGFANNKADRSVTILRPPLVFGPGQKANMLRLMRAVQRGVPLPLGAIRNLRSYIYVGNLAAAVRIAFEAAKPGCRTYTIADTELSTPDLIRRVAKSLGCRANLFSIPVSLLAVVARISGREDQFARLSESLIVDSTTFKETFGWHPPYGMDAALRDTARWMQDGENVP